MKQFQQLNTFRDGDHGLLNIVVETPRGSRAKYKYEPARGAFELNKSLALGFAFPFPFGFIPGTRGGDGDPLDVLLVTTLELPLAVIVPARLIGAIQVQQTDPHEQTVRNDRLLAAPDVEHEDRPVSGIDDLLPGELRDIEAFFVQSGARDGKQLKIIGRHGGAEATEFVQKARVGQS